MEWPVNASGDEKPVDDGGAIARSDQVDVVRVGGRVVLRHPRDQLQDEADVVGLGFKDMYIFLWMIVKTLLFSLLTFQLLS